MSQKRLLLSLVCLTLPVLLSCDPEKDLNLYFEKAGLSRLATLRDDIEPGGLIVVANGRSIYADNMVDYMDGEALASFQLDARNGTSEYNAVLRKYEKDRSLEPSVAVSFVEKILPVSLGSTFKLTSKVRIDLTEAKVKRFRIPAIQRFLGATNSQGFREAVWNFASEAKQVDAYLVYEAWRAKKLKISAEKDSDITPTLNVGQVQDLISKVEGKFRIKKTAKSELEIEGDRYYVFAIRTAHLTRGAQRPGLALRITEFHKPADWGIMSVGTDDRYSAAPSGDFKAPLVLAPERSF